MKKYLIIFCAMLILMPKYSVNAITSLEESVLQTKMGEEDLEEDNELYPYPKLEDLMKELKEKRKIIEQQRLEEIKAKKLEEEKQKQEIEESMDVQPEKQEKPNETSKDTKVPKLIVRLRGKHSTKYLCAYDFILNEDNKESQLSKELITDYNLLLKKPSLKVRADENINFEFSEEPKDLVIYAWDDGKTFPMKNIRGTIKVPDLEKKIVVIVEGKYKEGFIRYAVVLDIRK